MSLPLLAEPQGPAPETPTSLPGRHCWPFHAASLTPLLTLGGDGGSGVQPAPPERGWVRMAEGSGLPGSCDDWRVAGRAASGLWAVPMRGEGAVVVAVVKNARLGLSSAQ